MPQGTLHSMRPSSPGRSGSRFETAALSARDAPPEAGDNPVGAAGTGLEDTPKSKRARRRKRRHRKGAGLTAVGSGAKNPVRGASHAGTAGVDAPRPSLTAKANGALRPADPTAQKAEPASPVPVVHSDRAHHHPHHHEAERAYAALDLGTNNCRLLVAVPGKPGSFRVVDAFSRIVRLGEGLTQSGQLSAIAMDRAVEALKICADKLDGRPIGRTRLIATEACRVAENGAAFIDRVETETGLRLEIITRETEARLAVAGCSSLVDRSAGSTVLFDIGGGSSEIALIRLGENASRRLSDNIVAWTSLPVGVVTLSERFGGERVTPQLFADMTAYAQDLLAEFAASQAGRFDHDADEAFHLIGTSGTVTTLAGIHLGLERYDRRRVDGLWLADHEVNGIHERLLSWSYEERVANPCIGADRADLVLAGCAILEAIRKVWPARRLRVADRGLREGLLTEMMAADGVWRRHRYRRAKPGGQS